MVISDDMSYVNKAFVERGLARPTPNMIRLERYFTEEQKAENAAFARKVGMPSKEWSEHCEFTRQRIADDNLSVLSALEQEYNIGQFRPDRKFYQFWFWCNDLYNTVRDGRSGRDYSYCTLSMDDKLCYYGSSSKDEIFDNCKKMLAEHPTTSNQAFFQYATEYDPDAVCLAAHVVFDMIKDQWIYMPMFGQLGKISILEGKGSRAFVFRKKYSKHENGLYAVSDTTLVHLGIQRGIY